MLNSECYAIFSWDDALKLERIIKARRSGPTRDGVAIATSSETLIYSTWQENAMNCNNTISVPIIALFHKTRFLL